MLMPKFKFAKVFKRKGRYVPYRKGPLNLVRKNFKTKGD